MGRMGISGVALAFCGETLVALLFGVAVAFGVALSLTCGCCVALKFGVPSPGPAVTGVCDCAPVRVVSLFLPLDAANCLLLNPSSPVATLPSSRKRPMVAAIAPAHWMRPARFLRGAVCCVAGCAGRRVFSGSANERGALG